MIACDMNAACPKDENMHDHYSSPDCKSDRKLGTSGTENEPEMVP